MSNTVNFDLLKAIHTALDKDSNDLTTRLQLADLYEEQGKEVLAAGQRWQVENNKWPEDGPYLCGGLCAWHNQESLDVFWAYRDEVSRHPKPTAVLPNNIWVRLRGLYGKIRPNFVDTYMTRQDAEADLARVLQFLYRKAL